MGTGEPMFVYVVKVAPATRNGRPSSPVQFVHQRDTLNDALDFARLLYRHYPGKAAIFVERYPVEGMAWQYHGDDDCLEELPQPSIPMEEQQP